VVDGMSDSPRDLPASRRRVVQRAAVFAGILSISPGRARAAVLERENGGVASRKDTKMVDGLTTIPSSFGAKETMDRLESVVKAKGLTVFARVDHAAGATAAGLSLRPTEVLIFGNARGGTPLMVENQTAGIDLPLKALVHQDADGKVWLSYNDPAWIAQRHGLGAAVAATVHGLAEALGALTKHAATAT
jgi:uncharacterized protein (DUF302 family)